MDGLAIVSAPASGLLTHAVERRGLDAVDELLHQDARTVPQATRFGRIALRFRRHHSGVAVRHGLGAWTGARDRVADVDDVRRSKAGLGAAELGCRDQFLRRISRKHVVRHCSGAI